jgi:ubiquinone/menaquinone biosynthesis C-methylase UbiE
MDNNKFYNSAAADYDEMISFEKSLQRKQNIFGGILTKKMKSAADLGCGTGVDSIALAKLGLEVIAFDPSDEMLSKAKTNSESAGVKIDFINSLIHNIPHKYNNQFEIVVSFGNTFANIERETFEESMQKCYDILGKGGVLIIHILNYHKIMSEKNRIVNITRGQDKYFIRFYDFGEDEISFNILTFNQSQPSDHKIISTKLIPYSIEDFDKSLLKIGFRTVEFYSNLNWDEFDLQNSKDLFVKAARS